MVGAFFSINAEFLFPPASTTACKLKEGLLSWVLFAKSLKLSHSAFSILIKFSEVGDLHTIHTRIQKQSGQHHVLFTLHVQQTHHRHPRRLRTLRYSSMPVNVTHTSSCPVCIQPRVSENGSWIAIYFLLQRYHRAATQLSVVHLPGQRVHSLSWPVTMAWPPQGTDTQKASHFSFLTKQNFPCLNFHLLPLMAIQKKVYRKTMPVNTKSSFFQNIWITPSSSYPSFCDLHCSTHRWQWCQCGDIAVPRLGSRKCYS